MFLDDERSNRLRPQILTELVAQYMNDVERARFFGLPESTRIRERTKIVGGEHLVMGEWVSIGEGTCIDAGGGLEIGDHTIIGPNVLIFTHSSWLAAMTQQNYPGSDLIKRKPVKIGKGCFIGGNTVILAGVTIGDCATVQPCSMVARNVPEYTLVQGNPAKVAGRYDAEYLKAEAEAVQAENARRRKILEDRGIPSPWGAPGGDFSKIEAGE